MSTSSNIRAGANLLARLPTHQREALTQDLSHSLAQASIDQDAFANIGVILAVSARGGADNDEDFHHVQDSVGTFAGKILSQPFNNDTSSAIRSLVSVLAGSNVNEGQSGLAHSICESIASKAIETICSAAKPQPSRPMFSTPREDTEQTNGGESQHFDLLACISFVKMLSLKPAGFPWAKLELLIPPLLSLLSSGDSHVHRHARDAVQHVLRAVSKTQNPSSLSHFAWLDLWEHILDLSTTQSKHERTAACSIWLQLISASPSHVLESIMCTSRYWSNMQTGLADGFPEQQKICLALLQASIPCAASLNDDPLLMANASDSPDAARQYEKFVTIYETVILGRYLNQVQECLPELRHLCSPDSKLHKSWIYTFFSAALAKSMQESIRKIIGRWIFQNGVEFLTLDSSRTIFLVKSYILPWATTGNLYNVTYGGGLSKRPRCIQGQLFAQFLTDVIQSADEVKFRRDLVLAILDFLDDKDRHLFAFARPFVLKGLLDGIAASRLRLELADVETIERVGWMPGWPAVARDLMLVQCARISELTMSSTTQQFESRLGEGAKRVEASFVARSPEVKQNPYLNPSDWDAIETSTLFLEHQRGREKALPNISSLYRQLQDSGCADIRGPSCLAACYFTLEAFNRLSDADLNAEEIAFILQAIFNEAETQDWPRRITRLIPFLVLHRTVIKLTSQNVDLSNTIESILVKLRELASSKIYLFSPIATAYRHLLLLPDIQLPVFLAADFLVQYAQDPPTIRVEFQLELIMADLLKELISSASYQHYYGETAAYGYASILDAANRLPDSERSNALCDAVLTKLLNRWMQQKGTIPVFSSFKNTLQLQIMLVLVERATQRWSAEEIDDLAKKFWHIVALEPLPRFRYLLEWILIRLASRSSPQQDILISRLKGVEMANPRIMVSSIRVALGIAQLPTLDELFGARFASLLIAQGTSAKRAIRHEAQWSFPILMECARRRRWTKVLENTAMQDFDQYIRSLDIYENAPKGRVESNFDPSKDHNLAFLVQGSHLTIDPPEVPKLSLDDLLRVQSDDIQNFALETNEPIVPLGEPQDAVHSSQTTASRQIDLPAEEISAGNTVPLQTKGGTLTDVLRNMALDDGDDRGRPQDIILVASLVDSPYNLGGLSRIGEIFGIKSLQVQRLNIVENHMFQSTAVSSHKWLPMEQLEVVELEDWLSAKKLEGYTVVGIEQTDTSRILSSPECRIPEKTILVLGTESFGLPANLLAQMDFCVEIEQVGMTRSANVQTAAAIVLYEAFRQKRADATRFER